MTKINPQDIEDQLITIVQQFLAESGSEYLPRKVTLDASLQRHFGIDSLGRAELFQRIENHFNVRLPDNLIAEADTLEDLAVAITAATPPDKIQKDVPRIQILDKSLINPLQAKTLIDVLLLYATGDPDRPHIYLQDDKGREEIITYGKLFDNALRVAHALLKKGLMPGSTVAIMQPTNPGFFYTFFGTLLASCIPVPIYPPFRMHQIEAYAKQEAKILQSAEVRVLVTFTEAEKLSRLLRAFVPSLKDITTVDALLRDEEKAPIFGAKSNDFAMIQYTSGSTSAPKGVLLTHHNLLSNIRAYGEAIKVTHQDSAVSWAPLYHDLGLIGMWLGSLYYGIPLTLMSPLTFLNRPERWLWAIHHHRGTLSGGPNFAYELCIRKIDPSQIEGLDLSSWRMAANGAEAIHPKTLERFSEKFAPYGFRSGAHTPMYGLAESSVCVAVSPLNRPPRIDKIERKAFEEDLKAIPSTEPNSLEFVACGVPIPNHFVRILDESKNELPERHVGLLYFSGPSSMQGYYGNPEATLAIYHDGWWNSGDLAYIADGEIFITGRKKDVIIKAGRNLYPIEVEELTSQIDGVRKGCAIAFGTTDPKRGTERLIVVAETREKKPPHPENIIEAINSNILNALDVAPDQIILVPPQSIPKTSSGKLQRAACKNAYLTGKLKKHRTPLWIQLTRVGFTSMGAKIRKGVTNFLKSIYTLYLYSLVSITLIPIYCCVLILPESGAVRLCKYWARGLFFFAFCPLRITGSEFLKSEKLIFAANHASYIDGLLLLAVLPVNTKLVGKKELLTTPIIRTFMRKLRYISVDRTDLPKGLEDAKEMEDMLRAGNSLAIFPEGTFYYAAGLRAFKMGAFKTAVETNTPICPIALQGTRAIWRGDERLMRPGIIHITICKPIASADKNWKDITELKTKVRGQILQYCGEPSLDLMTQDIAE